MIDTQLKFLTKKSQFALKEMADDNGLSDFDLGVLVGFASHYDENLYNIFLEFAHSFDGMYEDDSPS